MRRWIKRCVLILVFAVQSAGQGPPRSLALMQQAIEKSELRVGEVAPFRLTAEIQTKAADSKPQSGKYELVWVSPERWREDITVSGVKETRIGGAGKIWQFPSRSPEVQGIRNRMRDLAFREELGVAADDRISGSRERDVKGARVVCVKAKRQNVIETEYCFDANAGLLLRSKGRGSGWLEYLDYKQVESRSFPQRLLESGKEVARILALETKIQPDGRIFDPPAGVAAEPGCQYPRFPMGLKMEDPEYPMELRRSTAKTVLAGLVTTKGSIEDVRVVSSGGPGADSSALRAVRHWKFQPATCNGTPVAYPVNVEVDFAAH